MWKKLSKIKSSPSSSMPKTLKFFDPSHNIIAKIGPGTYNPDKPKVIMAKYSPK
jgi:hypothetical protein